MLTPTQEDYLEAIYQIRQSRGSVHVTELAARLGCRLPTVTRTVRRLVTSGYVVHEARGAIELTQEGAATARHLIHRHRDLVAFLSDVLGLSETDAERDACQLEHGMSPLAAQRLHLWLEHVAALAPAQREPVIRFRGRDDRSTDDFQWLPDGKTPGWRG